MRAAIEVDLTPSATPFPLGKASSIRTYVGLLRPQQWTKNLLVLAPLIFARQLFLLNQCLRALLLCAAFCAISSAVYIFNDVIDRKADRAHPRKRNRPIASGKVKPITGGVIAFFLVFSGLALTWDAEPAAIACILGYLILQTSYAVFLKQLVILDVLSIAAGFVLRAVAGACAIRAAVSPWLLICTTLLALFLAFSKRRHELLASDQPSEHRAVLGEYNLLLLDQLIAIVTSCTVLAYVLYTFSDQTTQKFPSHLMPMTLPFVLYGIFRYLYLVYRKSAGGEPELLLLQDRPLLLDIGLWGIAVFAIAAWK